MAVHHHHYGHCEATENLPEHCILQNLHQRTHAADLERDMRADIERTLRIEFEADKLKYVQELYMRIENEMLETRKSELAASNANLRSQQDWAIGPHFIDNYSVREQALVPDFVAKTIQNLRPEGFAFAPDAMSQCAQLPLQAPPGLELPPLVDKKMVSTPRELGSVEDWDFISKGDKITKFTFPVRATVFASTNHAQALESFAITVDNKKISFQLHVTAEHISDRRHGWSFKKSGGRGHIELKCRADDPPDREIEFAVFIGRGQEPGHRPREFVRHNFSTRPTAGLAADLANWSFLNAAEPGRNVVFINIEFRNLGQDDASLFEG